MEQAQLYEHKFGLTHLLPKFHGLASNTQQFHIKGSPTSRVVNEVVATDNQRLENKITELMSLVRQLAIGQHHNSPPLKVYGMCASVEHPTNACPTLQKIKPQRYQPPPPFRPKQPIQPIQQSSLEEECVCHNSGFVNTDWSIDHHGVIDISDVVKVVVAQPPLPSMVQPLHVP
ncbi:hypothetical protein CR513_09780, partial [Mucuna pruriens]